MHRSGDLKELKQAPFTVTSRSYSNSKLAMMLWTYDLQRRLRDEGEGI